MPAPTRRKGPTRLAVLAGLGIATAGFFIAIITGPQPANASTSTTGAASTSAPTVGRQLNGSNPSLASQNGQTPSVTQVPFGQSPLFTSPRLRSRGS